MNVRADVFAARARRAYEWGRLRHSPRKTWPALLLTFASYALCREPLLTATIGATLFAGVTGLVWYGRTAAQAAVAGQIAGIGAFALPIAAFYLRLYTYFDVYAAIVAINGGSGVVIGCLLSAASARLDVRRNVFLVSAATVAALSGMLGCLLYGPIGLAGMAAGILLSTAPVAIYRYATA